MSARWLVIPRWDDFQHYKDRDPPWIKVYTRLMHDDAFLALSGHRRAILLGLWLEYATSGRRLLDETASLSRRLQLRVTTRDLESLNHAGFLAFSASAPLAARYHDASPEKRREEDPLTPEPSSGDLKCRNCGEPVEPGRRCRSCGASPRAAGSNARTLSKPKAKSAYERAEAFTRNVGWQLERSGFLDELAVYELDDAERAGLDELRALLAPGSLDLDLNGGGREE